MAMAKCDHDNPNKKQVQEDSEEIAKYEEHFSRKKRRSRNKTPKLVPKNLPNSEETGKWWLKNSPRKLAEEESCCKSVTEETTKKAAEERIRHNLAEEERCHKLVT